MSQRFRESLPTIAVAAAIGLLVPLLSDRALMIAAGAAGLLAALGFLWHAVSAHGLGPRFIATVIVGAATVAVTWTGLRGPGDLTLFDPLLALGAGAVLLLWLQGDARFTLPVWLVAAGAGFVFGALLGELFVEDVPPEVRFSSTGTGLGLPAESSDLTALFKLELSMVLWPVLLGAVAATYRRVDVFADLWLLSAVAGAVVACVDFATSLDLGPRLTGTLWADREAGLTAHPNHLGLICAMTLPIALVRLDDRQRWRRVAGGLALGALGAAILVSGSRLALAGAVVALALTAAALPSLRTRILAISAVALAAAIIAAPFAQGDSFLVAIDRLLGSENAQLADEDRSAQLERSWSLAFDHSFTGIGFASIADAHSLPLQALEAGGFVALAALLLYVAGVVALGIRLSRDERIPKDSRLLAGALSASVGTWFLAGALQNPIIDRFVYVPVGLVLGLSLAAGARSLARAPAPPPLTLPEQRPAPVSRDRAPEPVA